MEAFDKLGLDMASMLLPWIAILISISAAFWFKDFATNFMQGLKFRFNPAFNEGDEVNAESLFNHNLIRKKSSNVKILGNGNLKKSLKIKVHAVTKSAEEKIKKSGSSIELLNELITENKD